MQLPQFVNSWSLKIDCLLVIGSSNCFFCWKFLLPVWISASFFWGQLVSSGPVCSSTRWFFCKSVLLPVVILPRVSSTRWFFCQSALLPVGSSACWLFDQVVLLLVGYSASWFFCQLALLSVDTSASWLFYQMILLPGTSYGSCLFFELVLSLLVLLPGVHRLNLVLVDALPDKLHLMALTCFQLHLWPRLGVANDT